MYFYVLYIMLASPAVVPITVFDNEVMCEEARKTATELKTVCGPLLHLDAKAWERVKGGYNEYLNTTYQLFKQPEPTNR